MRYGAKSHHGPLGRSEALLCIHQLLLKPKMVMQIQHEMVDQQKAFADTSVVGLVIEMQE